MRFAPIVVAGLTGVTLACSGTDPVRRMPLACAQPAPGAIVTFAWDSRPDTMRMVVNDAATVGAACAYVANGSGSHIPAGPIVKGAGVDASVPFHYIPDSLRLVDLAMELCDGRLMRTPAAVDEFMRGATGLDDPQKAPFCPWGARPVWVE